MLIQGSGCSAGDSSAYERRGSSLDDVVIISALRTPVCRAKRGALKDCPADDLLAAVLKATLEQSGVEASAVGDIVVGSVLGPSSQRANEARIAMFLAGFPETVPVRTVNRCAFVRMVGTLCHNHCYGYSFCRSARASGILASPGIR